MNYRNNSTHAKFLNLYKKIGGGIMDIKTIGVVGSGTMVMVLHRLLPRQAIVLS
jgi:hypothetical protein